MTASITVVLDDLLNVSGEGTATSIEVTLTQEGPPGPPGPTGPTGPTGATDSISDASVYAMAVGGLINIPILANELLKVALSSAPSAGYEALHDFLNSLTGGYKRGDINQSGAISAADIVALLYFNTPSSTSVLDLRIYNNILKPLLLDRYTASPDTYPAAIYAAFGEAPVVLQSASSHSSRSGAIEWDDLLDILRINDAGTWRNIASPDAYSKALSSLQSVDIGVTVQPYDEDLTSWAGIAPSEKQDTLVSATNIKTVNGSSILGPGDLSVGSSFDPANPGPIGANPNTVTATKVTVSAGTHTTSSERAVATDVTWNGSGQTMVAHEINITDTASAADSKGLSVKVGGVEKAAILKNGNIVGNNTGASSEIFSAYSGASKYWYVNSWAEMWLSNAGAGLKIGSTAGSGTEYWIQNAGFYIHGGNVIGWGSAEASGTIDTGLGRNAAGVVEANNGTLGTFRDLKLRNLIATGRIDNAMYTTATRPAFTNGATIFDSDLDKLLSGGAAGWEVVTSV